MKILFVCKHNRFRSKVAEAFFNFYCKKEGKHKARSRGIIKDIPSAKSVVRVMKERGIRLGDRISRKINKEDIEWADLIVIVADDIPNNAPKSLFKGKKIIRWKISDVNQDDLEGIEKRVRIIRKRVLSCLQILNQKS